MIANDNAIINNIFYNTSIPSKSKGKKELLSVTVIKKHSLSNEALRAQVEKELQQYCGVDSCIFIKHYKIGQALPKLNDLQYEVPPSETRLTNSIFLAGDTQLNGSLNAAIISGERAALGMLEVISSDTTT